MFLLLSYPLRVSCYLFIYVCMQHTLTYLLTGPHLPFPLAVLILLESAWLRFASVSFGFISSRASCSPCDLPPL